MSAPRRAAVVLLTALLSAVLLSGCAGADGSGEETAHPAPSPTASARPTPARPGAWVDTLPVGQPPQVGYVVGHAYHSSTGAVVHLAHERPVTWLTPLGDGWLAVDDRFFEGTTGLELLDHRGRIVRELGTVAGRPVRSPDGRTLRWISFTPPEVSGSERVSTRLHVADVATGAIRTRRIHRDPDTSPRVRQPERTGDVGIPQRVLPGRWLRRAILATATEDRRHRLVAVRRGRDAAILRVDVRTGAWELAVDWTSLARHDLVVFETVG